jgi:hypothetical protein
MLKRPPTYKLIFILTNILFACNNHSDNNSVENVIVDTVVTNKQSRPTNDAVDYFRNAVDSLGYIDYYISGQDSLVISNDPTEFIEMNGIRNCFQSPFDKSDTGLIAYRQVDKVRKFHVAKNRIQKGPSANIIQISFIDTFSATKWYDRLNECKDFNVIKMKPKTEIWLEDKYVYFIQSYYDSDRQILNAITNKFRQNIK